MSDFGRFLGVLGSYRSLWALGALGQISSLVVLGGFWRFMAVLGCFGRFLAVVGIGGLWEKMDNPLNFEIFPKSI